MAALHSVNSKILLACVLGLGLSVYAFVVESKLEHDDKYEPMCDIHEHISCSKAFMSEYGKGFGLIPPTSVLYLPNSLYGIMFYCLAILLMLMKSKFSSQVLFFLVILSNFSSVFFASILYFILADFCIICVSIYAVNAVMLVLTYKRNQLFKVVKNKTS